LDYADDVTLLAKLPELLVPALEMMASKAASLGLDMNCLKSKLWTAGRMNHQQSQSKAGGCNGHHHHHHIRLF